MDVVFSLVFIIIVFFFLFIRKKSNKKLNKKTKHIEHGKFHCVTVQFPKQACAAVKKLKGKRILSAEAPVFPLSGCDAATCNCRFQHHEERRVDDRRDVYHKTFDEFSESTIAMQQRAKTDRRKKN